MKEYLKKVWPLLLIILCVAAGVISIIFFVYGPYGKGQYDILALGTILLALSLISIIADILVHKEKKKK